MPTSKKAPNADDIAIGARVRAIRTALGLSQEKLGEALGITFQQVQKYEKGTNRISGSRLIAIAGCLGVSVGAIVGEDGREQPGAMVPDPETAQVVRLMPRLTPEERGKVVKIVRAFLS